MGRAFGFLSLIIVVAVGAYIYMHQTQSVMTAGTSSPTATVDLMGVRNDLLAIAQAERSHAAMNGGYVSIDELREKGELTMSRNNRGPYAYSAEVSGSSFRGHLRRPGKLGHAQDPEHQREHADQPGVGISAKLAPWGFHPVLCPRLLPCRPAAALASLGLTPAD